MNNYWKKENLILKENKTNIKYIIFNVFNVVEAKNKNQKLIP